VTGESLTCGQRAVSARQAIAAYAQARRHPSGTVTRGAGGRDPVQEQGRLSRLLCDLRHHADHARTLAFHDVLSAARQDTDRSRVGYDPVSAAQADTGRHALDAYERDSRAHATYHGSAWPAGTVADIQAYAGGQGITFEAAITGLTTALVTDLLRYANGHGLDFEAAVSASSRTHAGQRLREEGPFETGQEGRPSPDTLRAAASAAAMFRPVATHQGIVTAFSDAEWHLVRTSARIRDREGRGFPEAYRPDTDDRRTLSDALSETCGLTSTEIHRRLAPGIDARATEIEHGVTAAAELGHAHGRAWAQPFCDLDTDGDATALLRAFGETEWTTAANHPYRLALATAYTEAYLSASGQGPPSAISPARIAARDFPRTAGQPAPRGGAPPAPGPASQARSRPGSRPRGHA
jgi:hypothetical protein